VLFNFKTKLPACFQNYRGAKLFLFVHSCIYIELINVSRNVYFPGLTCLFQYGTFAAVCCSVLQCVAACCSVLCQVYHVIYNQTRLIVRYNYNVSFPGISCLFQSVMFLCQVYHVIYSHTRLIARCNYKCMYWMVCIFQVLRVYFNEPRSFVKCTMMSYTIRHVTSIFL